MTVRRVMNPDTVRFIDDCYDRSVKDPFLLTVDDIEGLLSIDPDSEECEYMGTKARELARIRSNNKASVSTSFGLDYIPCKASCRFCSFGEKWGLMEGQEYYIPDDEIVSMIRDQLSKGFRKFTLRTTEYYSVDRICDLARKIRSEIADEKFILSVNMGELSVDDVKRLKECGINNAYHTLHLREGVDTPFRPETRLRTMANIKAGGLNLSCGVDPIGIEHTNRELAENIVVLREQEPRSICSMMRVNPKGTPVGDLPEISENRHAQIAAVIRFASKNNVSAVPPNRKAMMWGANGTAIGTGANPRDSVHDKDTVGKWRFSFEDTRQMFKDTGYDI